ncbi:MAG: alpha/beta hydrolase [Desulfatitalea sp.]
MRPSSEAPIFIQEFQVKVDDVRLAARRIVPKGAVASQGPVLVFLHEGLGCMRLWGDFPEVIAAASGLPALLYDRQGHGLSDPLPSGDADVDYLRREALDVLPRVLSLCGVRDALFIGHSDGGTFALMLAAQQGTSVRGIVTEAAHVFVDEPTRAGIRRAVDAFGHGDLKSRLQKYHGPGVETLFWRWAHTWLADDFSTWTIVPLLAQVRCPVLAVQGDGDEYGTLEQLSAITTQVGGRAEAAVIPGCRHTPHQQARAVVAERVLAFIRAIHL